MKLEDDRYVLLVTQHHIISDGWSMSVLMRDLSALYTAYLKGTDAQLPALRIQYADYASWQRNATQSAELDRQLGYWRSRLQDAPATLDLPTDRPRRAVASFKGGLLPFVIPEALSAELADMAQRHGVTLFGAVARGFSKYCSPAGADRATS